MIENTTSADTTENTSTQSAYVSPASFAQQRLWFLGQLFGNSSAYNITHVLRLTNRLDVLALERSLKEIVARHDSLRTAFASIAGVPMQVISEEMEVPLLMVDLAETPSLTARREEAQHIVDEDAARLFDLAHGPLLRTTLIQVDSEEHMLIITMHHSISDGWSVSVFLHELTTLYTAFMQGRPSPLP